MHPSTFRRVFFLFFGKLEDKTSNVLLDSLQPTLNYMRLFPHMHAIRHLGKQSTFIYLHMQPILLRSSLKFIQTGLHMLSL